MTRVYIERCACDGSRVGDLVTRSVVGLPLSSSRLRNNGLMETSPQRDAIQGRRCQCRSEMQFQFVGLLLGPVYKQLDATDTVER